jgi:hypothetical protein
MIDWMILSFRYVIFFFEPLLWLSLSLAWWMVLYNNNNYNNNNNTNDYDDDDDRNWYDARVTEPSTPTTTTTTTTTTFLNNTGRYSCYLTVAHVLGCLNTQRGHDSAGTIR